MSRVRVKICGLTRARDVQGAVAAGADLLGFVFAASPRQLSVSGAQALLGLVPPGVQRVALFMDQGRDEVERVLAALRFDLLQFHGNEDNAYCSSFGVPFVKAIAMGDAHQSASAHATFPGAAALLLDSHAPGAAGGTGRAFDWSRARQLHGEIWLAGGLTAENVGQAISEARPRAVDVSSGVERAPGIKDRQLMTDFIAAARAAKTD
jgi:phosphoribosylanthranilate isomerase